MTTLSKMLHVKHLQKSFKHQKVLKDVSFSVNQGTIFVLLGSNGAGKTTLIKILTTTLASDSGQIEIAGYPLETEIAAIRQIISLTGQFAAVDNELTGKENLSMICALKKIKNQKKTVEELLTRFDLVESADRLVKDYSGGMRRRLDIAISFIGEPKLLFLDEPTTGLDPQNRLATWLMIKEMATKGRTIFLTTQYLEEAEFLADQVAILHEGMIMIQGTPEEIKAINDSVTIEIDLLTKQDLDLVSTKFASHALAINETALSISFDLPNNFQETFKVLEQLNRLPVTINRFSQKSASLEDTFLKLIEKGREK
jgi:ABC-2 type transport system ATP-binding protein